MTMECVEKLIKKDMLDPINGKHMKDKDIIQLQMVSKYSTVNEKSRFGVSNWVRYKPDCTSTEDS